MKSLASVEVVSDTRVRLLRLSCDDKPLWGSMNATQMARHLTETYEIALGERAMQPVPGSPQRLMKWVALRSGLRWPRNIQSTPELVRAIQQPCIEDLGELVAHAITKMERVAAERGLAESHPFFGRMTSQEWVRWGYLHADHHLRQFGR